MRTDELRLAATVLGREVRAVTVLAGGFSHETCLLTLDDGQVVARLGGPDPRIEAAVMAAAGHHVPVPPVLHIAQVHDKDGSAAGAPTRPLMVLGFVAGTPLSQVLSDARHPTTALHDLGTEVGRVVAAIGEVTFDRPGFFVDEHLTVGAEQPWSQQLPLFAAECMRNTPRSRLDAATRQAWVALCTRHAPALTDVDDHRRLVHADINPKNILVSRAGGGWLVNAVLDWEFAYSGCPYGDAANMARFPADCPPPFRAGFRAAFAEHHPAGTDLPENWEHLGRVLDMFALSDLVTRPEGHPTADQAADLIRHLTAEPR